MRVVWLTLFLIPCSAFASSGADPALPWLRTDAPHVHLVPQDETETEAALRFVQNIQHWPHVWCPWPGYEPPVPLTAGDLLVRVRINGRSWVQRVRLGNGDRPHMRALQAYDVTAIKPSVWVPYPQSHPPQQLTFDLAEVDVREPARAVYPKVQDFWPGSPTQGPVVRLDAGHRDFLSAGVALMVVPSGKGADPKAWLRAVVAAVFPSYSYALLLEPRARAAPGDLARSPTAWCSERKPAAP